MTSFFLIVQGLGRQERINGHVYRVPSLHRLLPAPDEVEEGHALYSAAGTEAEADGSAHGSHGSHGPLHGPSAPVPVALTPVQRLRFLASLWPYTVPLLVVYVSEYALQSGAWSSIGFPTQSRAARRTFYDYANWYPLFISE